MMTLNVVKNNLEGMSYLLTLTKVWLASNLHLISNAEIIIIPPEKHWLYFSKQAFTKGNNHNKAIQLSLVSCTETHISSRHQKKHDKWLVLAGPKNFIELTSSCTSFNCTRSCIERGFGFRQQANTSGCVCRTRQHRQLSHAASFILRNTPCQWCACLAWLFTKLQILSHRATLAAILLGRCSLHNCAYFGKGANATGITTCSM